jgi:uncharacterized protein
MVSGTSFGSLRIILVTIAVLSQVYLFLRIRNAIRSSRRSERFKSLAVPLVGATIGLLFVMNWQVMYRPIPWLDPPMAAQVLLFYGPAVWSLGSIFSAILLFLIQVVGWLGRIVVRTYQSFAGPTIPNPVNISRRRFLQAGVGGIAAAPFLLSGYGAAYAGQGHAVLELMLPFGLRVRGVQLTDIHAGIFMTRESIRRYVDQIIALKPELFLLTGDYISNSTVFFPGFVEEVARISSRYGTFATLGNHENWYGKRSYFEAIFREHGIYLLQNAHQVIQTEQGPFAVAGIDDLRSGRPDLEAALRGLDSAIPTILLSHRPEIFPRAAAHGIPLTLSGHYHGGQVKLSLPGGDFSLATLRTPYPEGLYRSNGSRLYVSRGIGTTFTPVRLNAPPEVTVLHLT